MNWLKRRKHRVSFIDDAVVRHQESVDFLVPDDAPRVGGDGNGGTVVALPLFVLRKAPRQLLDFDFRDAAGNSISLPMRAENAAVSGAALRAQAQQVLDTDMAGASLHPDLAEELTAIAEGESPDTLTRADAMLEKNPDGVGLDQRSTLAADPDFCFLLGLLAWASIVAVPVSAAQGQQLLKLAYSEPIYELTPSRNARINLGWEALPGLVVDPFVGARTFHLEVHPPKGMNLCEGQLATSGRGEPELDIADATSRVLHLYVRHAEDKRSAFAAFDLVMQRDGYVNGAAWSALAVAMALLGCVVFANQLAANNSAAPAYLLLFPGLIATYVTKPGDHALTGRLLGWSRLILVCTAICAYLAAGWMIVAPSQAVRATAVSTTTGSHAPSGKKRRTPAGRSRKHARSPGKQSTATPQRPVHVELIQRHPVHLRAVWIPLTLLAFVATYLLFRTRQASSTV